jgi:hypothetical protein
VVLMVQMVKTTPVPMAAVVAEAAVELVVP